MRLSTAMHYGEHSGCKNNIFFDSKINPEISRNYISEINRKSSFVPFLSLFRGIPLHYACGMGRTNKRVRNYGRRQIASYLCTHVAPPPIFFPERARPHSASLRSKRRGISCQLSILSPFQPFVLFASGILPTASLARRGAGRCATAYGMFSPRIPVRACACRGNDWKGAAGGA